MANKLINLETNTFKVCVSKSKEAIDRYTANLKDGILNILVPENVDLNNSYYFLKTALPNIIEHFLKIEAERKLHIRLKELSIQHNLKYNKSKIFISKKTIVGRRYKSRQLTLGAYYKSTGNIKMNAFLMLMPDECIDEVLVHELCHSVYQNHSKDFYNLLYSKFPHYKLALNKRKEIVSLIFEYFR